VLINKEETDSLDVSVRLALAPSGGDAEVMRLEAPSLTARSGVTLGGTGVAADGGWTPVPLEAAERSSSAWQFRMPPASAAVLFIGPGAPSVSVAGR
jgi:hypothetical protein